MKAHTTHNDFFGTFSGDIQHGVGHVGVDYLHRISKFYELDENTYELLGVSIYGSGKKISIGLICVDKNQSTEEQKYIVKLILRNREIDDLLDSYNIVFTDTSGSLQGLAVDEEIER